MNARTIVLVALLLAGVLLAVTPAQALPGPAASEATATETARASTSPYRASWTTDGALLGTALATWGVGRTLDASRTPLSEAQAASMHHRQVNWFDRPATYRYSESLMDLTDRLGMLSYLAPLVLLADGDVRSDLGVIALMFAETFLLASTTPNLTKLTIHRYRPYVYNAGLSYEEKVRRDPGKSFVSNQAVLMFSTAAFMATVFGDYHPDSPLRPWVWAAALGVAGTTAILRHESGLHYATDLIAGAVLGAAIGYGVPLLHRRDLGAFSVTPSIGLEQVGLTARVAF